MPTPSRVRLPHFRIRRPRTPRFLRRPRTPRSSLSIAFAVLLVLALGGGATALAATWAS